MSGVNPVNDWEMDQVEHACRERGGAQSDRMLRMIAELRARRADAPAVTRTFSTRDLACCAHREVSMRKSVYHRHHGPVLPRGKQAEQGDLFGEGG